MIAIIEMPQGTTLKYEVNKHDGTLHLDRVLNQPVPYNYGFIPHTLCGDGDPLDVFVVGNIPIYPLTSVNVELLGVLHCTDNGEEDDKLIAMIMGDERGRNIGSDVVRAYLASYKPGFEVVSFGDKADAARTFLSACQKFDIQLMSGLSKNY